jgi:hypothetical protein
MSATRDSDTDLAKVFPDMQTIRREADPSRRRANLEKALDTPPVVDAALTILRQGLKEGEDPLYYEVPRGEPVSEPAAPANDSDAAPSPWSTPTGDAIPKELLPSASAPAASPTTETPQAAEAPGVHRARRPRGASVRAAVIALVAVLGPITLMWLLLVRSQGSNEGSSPASSARPSAAATAPTAPPAPATVGATAEAVVAPPSSATIAAPAPSASVDAGAVAAPPPPARPTTNSPGAKRPPVKTGPKPEDDNPEYFQ